MRKIITITFVTLDGVMQAPGGPKEDPSNGFAYGGWQFAWDEDEKDKVANEWMMEFMAAPFDLLLGRVTYDIWAAFWPLHKDEPKWGKPFDKAVKYVVSHKPIKLPWSNSQLITDDVVAEIRKLKNTQGPDLVVWGSGKLIQTLLQHDLIDRMHIWTYPITIGTGKKLLAEGTMPRRFKTVSGTVTDTGVLVATYEPVSPLKKSS
jgi:dihydrofolate reductase